MRYKARVLTSKEQKQGYSCTILDKFYMNPVTTLPKFLCFYVVFFTSVFRIAGTTLMAVRFFP